MSLRDGRTQAFELGNSVGQSVKLSGDLGQRVGLGIRFRLGHHGQRHRPARSENPAEHDAQRQLTQVTDPLGQVVKYGCSPDGKLTSITDANNHVTTFTLDAQSRAVQKTYADGSQQGTVYENTTNRVAKLIDAKGQTTSYTYNADNTVASIVYGATAPTASVSYTYDSGYPRPLTMADGTGTTIYTYYPVKSGVSLGANQMQSVTSPVAGTALADTITYSYDALGRVVGRSINGTAEATTFDALGRVSAMGNALDSFSYVYADATPRVSAISSTKGPAVALSYYDAKGDQLLKSMAYSTAGSTVGSTSLAQYSYTYDANHNILSFAQPFKDSKFAAMAVVGAAGSSNSDIERDIVAAALNATPTVKVIGGQWLSRLSKLSAVTPFDFFLFVLAGAVAFVLRQLLPRFGRRLLWPAVPIAATLALASCGGGDSASDGGGTGGTSAPTVLTSTYAYDQASRLLSATASANVATALTSPAANFAYDSASNLTTFTTGGSVQTLQYTDTNALTSGTYDANGSPTTLSTSQYTWDGANRIISASNGSNVSAFTYDGQSHLVRVVDQQAGKVVADKSYLWCGMVRCLEHDNTQAGSPVTKRYFSQGVVDSGKALYYISDRQGSVRQVVDASGTAQTKYDYDPYGARTRTAGTADTDIGYAGYFKHATSGLDLAVYRAYDSQHGNWVGRDPVGEAGGLNLYEYVGGNPASQIDPLGLWTINIGISGSINIPLIGPVGIGGGGFAGIAFDGTNLGFYGGGGGGVGGGAGGSIGIQFGGSNAKTICDLAGPFGSVSVSGGEGLILGGEGYVGQGSDGSTIIGGNGFIGGGAGTPVSGTAGATYTWVKPF